MQPSDVSFVSTLPVQVIRGIPFRHRSGVPVPCALTIGNFDGVHRGHSAMLAHLVAEAARRNLPAAVLTFEPHPAALFAPNAASVRLNTLSEKLALLRAAHIDYIYVARFNRAFAGLSAPQFIEQVLVAQLAARYVLVGEDFCFGKGRAGDFSLLAEQGKRNGYDAEAMPAVCINNQRISSSQIRQSLMQANFAKASELLGRPYCMSGRVVHGQKLGRTLGFPTANIPIKQLSVQAAYAGLQGIFATRVHLPQSAQSPQGGVYMGAASIGSRPTVDSSGRVLLEVYLLDFAGDLYGQTLRVEFLHKLRDETKFDGLAALTSQIQRDVDATRAFFTADPELLH